VSDTLTRRRLLGACAAGLAATLAGCAAFGGGGGETGETGETGGSGGQQGIDTIDYGETKTGYIDRGDETDPRYDDLSEAVRFEGEPGTVVEVTMTSDALDPYLVLTGPNGEFVGEDDDSAGDLNSRLTAPVESAGEYTVWAGSFSGDATGAYELTLEEQ
jgi:hypothetical protein